MSELWSDLPAELHDAIGRLAQQEGRTERDVMVEVLRRGLAMGLPAKQRDLSFLANTWEHDAESDSILAEFRQVEPCVRS
jgi:hypothetical protein